MRPRHRRQRDDVGIGGMSGAGHRLGGLTQARVGHVEACRLEGARYHLGSLVVTVEAGFGKKHAGLRIPHHADTSLAMMSLMISLVPPPIRVKRTSRR